MLSVEMVLDDDGQESGQSRGWSPVVGFGSGSVQSKFSRVCGSGTGM